MNFQQLASGVNAELTPALSLAIADRHLGWALTLSALAFFAFRSAPQTLRFSLGLAIFSISIVPTTWSLAHWLGLAYQTPSLVTQGLSLLYLFHIWRERNAASLAPAPASTNWPRAVLLLALALGWALALDTFAILPVQLYALGYSSTGALFGLIVATSFWGLARYQASQQGKQQVSALAVILLIAVAIHALTRLPSGNVWDAMLDPWLWIAAHVILLRSVPWRAMRWRRKMSG